MKKAPANAVTLLDLNQFTPEGLKALPPEDRTPEKMGWGPTLRKPQRVLAATPGLASKMRRFGALHDLPDGTRVSLIEQGSGKSGELGGVFYTAAGPVTVIPTTAAGATLVSGPGDESTSYPSWFEAKAAFRAKRKAKAASAS